MNGSKNYKDGGIQMKKMIMILSGVVALALAIAGGYKLILKMRERL